MQCFQTDLTVGTFIEQVRAELLRCSGTQFDPKIVNVILQRGTLEKAAELITPPARQCRAFR
jgi:hypothetical protein